jgi:hypothetical protein
MVASVDFGAMNELFPCLQIAQHDNFMVPLHPWKSIVKTPSTVG